LGISRLRKNKVVWFTSLFILIFYTLVDPILLYASNPLCPPPGTFDSYEGYCTTNPTGQFGECPSPYLYSSILKKCIAYPYCEGSYVYNANTKTCEPLTVSPVSGGTISLSGQWCVVDLNKDGEIDNSEFAYCVNTPQGYLCPLGLVKCNMQEKTVSCSSPYVYNSATGKCEYQPTTGTCQYQQISLPWQNMFVSWSSPCSYKGPNLSSNNCVVFEFWVYNAYGSSTLTVNLTPEMVNALTNVTFDWCTDTYAPNPCLDDDGSASFYVNGVLAASRGWGDCEPCNLSVNISPSYFKVGQNTITVQTGGTYKACTSCCRRMYLRFCFSSLSVSGWQCSLNNSFYTSQDACASNCHGACPLSGAYNTSTQKCELAPSAVCPSGSVDTGGNQCASCPHSNSTCVYYNGEWVCPSSPCFTEEQIEDDEPDEPPSGYENDRAIDEEGNCLGTIYIFSGKKMRCRPAGLQTGFHNCCDEAQGKLYDSTGSTGMMLGDAIKAVYLCLDLVKKARFLSQVKAFELVGNQVNLLDAYGQVVNVVTGAEAEVWQALAQSGKLPNVGTGVFQFDFQTNYSDYINAYLNEMAPTLAAQIVTMALTRAIDDPVLSAAVDLVAQAIFASLGWVSPWTVALSALNLVMSLFMGSCDEQDVITSTYKESGYCHYVGSRCVKKLPLVGCVQKAKVYCCFNSKLARIIHEQGRPQLTTFGPSGGWGSAKRPNCRGFTPEEFQSIDFGKIDFSEYVGDIQRRVRQNLEPQIMDIFQKSMENIQ